MAENLVLDIAKIIDPGAYAVWFNGTGPDARQHPLSTRQKYQQATAELKATQILARLKNLDARSIQDALVEFEIAGWERLGLPVADNPDLCRIIEKKHREPSDA